MSAETDRDDRSAAQNPDCAFIQRGDFNDCAHAGGGRGAKDEWCASCVAVYAVGRRGLDESAARVPSLPWTWTGGYPQRITGPDATLIAECWENPDLPAVIAPTICKAVNMYFGVDGEATYSERVQP